MISIFKEAFGGDIAEIEKRSPKHFLDNLKISAKVLQLHGQKDERVPIEQAEKLHQHLRDLSVPTRLEVYPEEDHVLSRSEPKVVLDIIQWLRDR